MLNPHDDRTLNANVDEVLAALKTNLAEHKEMVAEAKDERMDNVSLLHHQATCHKTLLEFQA